MINPSDVIIGLQAPGSQAVVRDSKNTMQRPPRRRLPFEQASGMLDSGVIEGAVKRNGPEGVIIIDWEKAAQLWAESLRVSNVEEG